MLPIDRLALAIETHARCYRLLRWLAEAMEGGFVPVRRAHRCTNAADSARDWIEEHYLSLPPESRPHKKDLKEFAAFFSTYVTTSFDVVHNPRVTLATECRCDCSMCSYLAKAPYLQVKRVRSAEKKRAQVLMIDRVTSLALEEGLDPPAESVEAVVQSSTTRRSAAYSAYGSGLIDRLDGYSDGVSMLALWRKIAWNQEGSPIRGFELRLRDFQEAEDELVAALRGEDR